MVFLIITYQMWELEHKESWVSKNWCFWTVLLEKTLESPLDFKEIQPVNPKGNQSWIFIGRTDAEAEVPILWLPEEKTLMLGKIDVRRRSGRHRMILWCLSLTLWTWVCACSRIWWWTGKPGMLQSMGSQSQTGLSDWTELNYKGLYIWLISTDCYHNICRVRIVFLEESVYYLSQMAKLLS